MTTPQRPAIKTLANLEAAFAGESMAHIKYRYFAKLAREAGCGGKSIANFNSFNCLNSHHCTSKSCV